MGSTVTTGAILFTDMVGSTDLRSRLGDDRFDDLRRDHDDLLARAVAAHDGVVLRWTGDGVKATFPTASDAVAAAVEMQRSITRYQRSDAVVAPFQVRIGLAAGEITIDAGDHHGIAVIEAARLEALARPGEILATDVVRALAQRRSLVQFEEVGERALKGLDQPVFVHRVVDVTVSERPALPRVISTDRRFPMVGRDAPLGELTERWNAARAGTASIAFVRGQPGMGKSRLVASIAEVAHADGALVLAGVCDSDLEVPYQPFANALREAVSLDDELDDAVTTRAGSLARLFPGSTSSPSENQPALARLELFEAVVSLVRRLANGRPVLLVLDDLHWSTAPTVLLLRHAIHELGDARVFVLCTYRDEDLPPSHALREVLAEVRTKPHVARIGLDVLGEVDVAEMAAAAMPGAARSRVASIAELVHRESGGNPFFVCELLQHLAATGQLDAVSQRPGSAGAAGIDRDAHLPVPDSVHDVVTQRLARLPAGTDDVLRSAAVIGPTFGLELLARVVGRHADDLLDVLDEACRASVVVEVGIEQFGFSHAIVRNALLDELSVTRRARAHRRIAEAIESMDAGPDGGVGPTDTGGTGRGRDAPGAVQFDELARHWRAAGDEARSITNVARAARRDLVALAYESACARYEEVIDFLARDARADATFRAEAWLGYGSARRALGDATYPRAIVKAARLARSTRSADLLSEAAALCIWPGSFNFVAGPPESDIVEVCEDALRVLDRSDPRRVQVLANLASHLAFDADRARREALIAEAKELAAEHDVPALMGVVLSAEFLCMWEPGTFERRSEIGRELSRLGRAIGDLDVVVVGGIFTANCLVEAVRLDEARALLVELQPVAAETRNRYFSFLADRLIVSIDIVRCRPDVAPDIDRLATVYADTYADVEGTWALQAGVRALQAGTFGSMVGAIQSAQTSAIPGAWDGALAMAQLLDGDDDAARRAIDADAGMTRNYFWSTVTQVWAEVAAGLGHTERCRSIFDELLPYRGRLGVTASGSLCFGLMSRSLGTLAVALGDREAATDLLTEAVTQADAADLPFDGVVACRLLADVTDDPHAARALRARACEVAERFGFGRELHLLRGADHPG